MKFFQCSDEMNAWMICEKGWDEMRRGQMR